MVRQPSLRKKSDDKNPIHASSRKEKETMPFVLFISFNEMLKEKFVNISGDYKFKTMEEFELITRWFPIQESFVIDHW